MKGTFKYVILYSDATQCELAVIIPQMVSHDHCVDPKKNPPIAAGFFTIHNGIVAAGGRSESLNLDSRPQDSEIIFWTLCLSGVQGLTAQARKQQQPQEAVV